MFATIIIRRRPINFMSFVKRAKSSALYITGDKAYETFAVLNPHIDFEERIQNKELLLQNLKLRNANINLDDIMKIWYFYQQIKAKKIGLEESKVSVSQLIKSLSQKGDKYAEKIQTLKTHAKMMKEDLKVLREEFWCVEEKATLKALDLPNILHDDTPHTETMTIYEYSQKGTSNKKFHLDIASDLNLIEYHYPAYYFLKNDAALFELNSQFHFSDELSKRNYTQFSNSDFARSVVVEGCGAEPFNPDRIFTISEEMKENSHANCALHLVGSASLISFMAYHARYTIFPTQLPFKYFSVGRKYAPVISKNNSLLNVTQETAVEIFVATKDETEEMNQVFKQVLQDAIDIYETLGHHFRVCYLSAKNLQNWESLHASIQMYSHYLHDYVEVGNVIISDNFISKRLIFNYGRANNLSFPRIISGTLFSVPKVLACLLEEEKLVSLEEFLKKYLT